MSMSHRLNAVRVQAKREFRSTMNGLGIYVVMALVFFIASYASVRPLLFDVSQTGVETYMNPFLDAFFYAVGISGAYLGLCAAISIARERDLGTLEVLFYGPVDSISYVAGKFIQQLMAFCVMLAFALVHFVIVSYATNLGIRNVLGLIVLSLFLTACFVGFGILLSSLSRRMTVSVILYLALMIFFLAFWMVHSYLQSLSIFDQRDYSPALVYVRTFFDNASFVMNWISPIAYFFRGITALGVGDLGQYAVSIASSVAYTLIMLVLSVVAFNRKGVRR